MWKLINVNLRLIKSIDWYLHRCRNASISSWMYRCAASVTADISTIFKYHFYNGSVGSSKTSDCIFLLQLHYNIYFVYSRIFKSFPFFYPLILIAKCLRAEKTWVQIYVHACVFNIFCILHTCIYKNILSIFV